MSVKLPMLCARLYEAVEALRVYKIGLVVRTFSLFISYQAPLSSQYIDEDHTRFSTSTSSHTYPHTKIPSILTTNKHAILHRSHRSRRGRSHSGSVYFRPALLLARLPIKRPWRRRLQQLDRFRLSLSEA